MALQVGSRGADVANVQQMLVTAGFEVTVDGVFGADTEEAVRLFQSQAGITADGVVGPVTMTALRTATGSQVGFEDDVIEVGGPKFPWWLLALGGAGALYMMMG